MKKSEITVSMPLSTFEELKLEKAYHTLLKNEINACFAPNGDVMEFDVSKAFELCKKYLPKRYQDLDFVFKRQ